VLSVLQQLDVQAGDAYPGVQCIVLCHTRELAFQICHEFERFKKYLPHIKRPSSMEAFRLIKTWRS